MLGWLVLMVLVIALWKPLAIIGAWTLLFMISAVVLLGGLIGGYFSRR